MKLPLALAELGSIDAYEFISTQADGSWCAVVRGAIEADRLAAREPAGVRLRGDGNAV